MKISALIPVKSFADAKQRLSPLLNAEERRILAEAMMRDVLSRVLPAQGLDATFVVTADDRVSEIASSLGSKIIREEKERGETDAVVFALREMKQMDIEADPFVLQNLQRQALSCDLAQMKRKAVVTEPERDDIGRREQKRVGPFAVVGWDEHGKGGRGNVS